MSARAAGGIMTALVVCLLVTACGDRSSTDLDAAAGGADPRDAEPDELPDGVVPDDYKGRLRATVTVLESPDHGPQLCLNVMESYPPQCGGPDIEGWQWSDVTAESANGTTWGTYTVTGRFSGDVFTLSEPAQPPQPPNSKPARRDPAAGCPEPPGGWVPPDPSSATPEDRDRAMEIARQTGKYGGTWIGWLVPDNEITEFNSTDPSLYVLNIITTGDAAALEGELREVWGGNLCVVPAKRTEAELNRIANQLIELPGAQSTSSDIIAGTAEVTVWVATESIWRQAAEEFGADVVEINGVFQPID